jgi:perosamine synthetase
MVLLSGPNINGNEWKYVKDCLDTGWVSSVGSYVTDFEKKISNYVGSKYAVATSSGTAALHLSLLLSEVKNNDLVLVTNVTFIATLNAIKYVGASPVLIDIDENSWQIDLDLLTDFLDSKTEIRDDVCILKSTGQRIKAIIPVHVLGNMCDMNKLVSICKKHNISIVEDAAESLGSSFEGKHSGIFGELGCFSFNGNKIITSGGGGMIVTDNEELAIRAKHLSTQAKADSFEYFHDATGYNYRLSNVAAAIGLAQLEQLDNFIQKKHLIKNFYTNSLLDVGDIQFQNVAKNVNSNWWLFTIKTKNQKNLLKSLNENKLQSRPFWIPMNKLPMFKNELYITINDISDKVYNNSLSIPCSTNISNKELSMVVDCIKKQF